MTDAKPPTTDEIKKMAKDMRLRPKLTAGELRSLCQFGSTEEVQQELDLMKMTREEMFKAEDAAKKAADAEEKNKMTFDKIESVLKEVNKDTDPPDLVLTSEEMKAALAYSSEAEVKTNLKLLKMSRKDSKTKAKRQLLPIPDLPSDMNVASVGDYKRVTYPNLLGEMGFKEQEVGGAINVTGQTSVSVSELKAAHIAQLIADNKLCNAYRPSADFQSFTNIRADKSALLMRNTPNFRDQIFVLAPQESVLMSLISTAKSEEAQSQKSLSVSASAKAQFECLSVGVGAGHSNDEKHSSKESCWHSVAQIKFPAVELGGFVTCPDGQNAVSGADTIDPPSNRPGETLEEYDRKLKDGQPDEKKKPAPKLEDVIPDANPTTLHLLTENGFTFVPDVLTLTSEDLTNFGVTLGQTRAVLRNIAAHQATTRRAEGDYKAEVAVYYATRKTAADFEEAVSGISFVEPGSKESLARNYFTNADGNYTPFYRRVEQLRRLAATGPFVVNPELLDAAAALAKSLPKTKDDWKVLSQSASRDPIMAFFAIWGWALPSRFLLGMMATYTSTVKIDSKTSQEQAQNEANVSASYAFYAVNVSAKGGTGESSGSDNRHNNLETTIVSGAAPASISAENSYQLGDHRHEPAAWRCIEVFASTPVLQLIKEEDRAVIVANMRWIRDGAHHLQDGCIYEICPKLDLRLRVDVAFSGMTVGTKVQFWGENSTKAQRYRVRVYDADQFTFCPLSSPEMALENDALTVTLNKVKEIQLAPRQRFRLRPAANGSPYFQIVTATDDDAGYWTYIRTPDETTPLCLQRLKDVSETVADTDSNLFSFTQFDEDGNVIG